MFFDKVYGSWKDIQIKKYEKILEMMPDLSGKRILDIGIGSGYFEDFLKGKDINADIIGVDITKPKGDSVLMASGDALPFNKNSFDMIVCFDTVHLIKNDDFKRVLKSGGLTLLSTFFNKQNFEERRLMLRNRLRNFRILKELVIEEKENEYVVLAMKK